MTRFSIERRGDGDYHIDAYSSRDGTMMFGAISTRDEAINLRDLLLREFPVDAPSHVHTPNGMRCLVNHLDGEQCQYCSACGEWYRANGEKLRAHGATASVGQSAPQVDDSSDRAWRRERIAERILPTIIAKGIFTSKGGARHAIEWADALIAALDEGKP